MPLRKRVLAGLVSVTSLTFSQAQILDYHKQAVLLQKILERKHYNPRALDDVF